MRFRELDDAIAWYDQGGQERGARLRADFDRAIDLILEWPKSGAVVTMYDARESRQFRHLRIANSHYHVVYYAAGEVLTVIAVAHDRRRPRYRSARF